MEIFLTLTKVEGDKIKRLVTPRVEVSEHASKELQLTQLDELLAAIRRELETKHSLEKCFDYIAPEEIPCPRSSPPT